MLMKLGENKMVKKYNLIQFTLDNYLDVPTYNMDKHLEAEISHACEFYSNMFKDKNGFRPSLRFIENDMESLKAINGMLRDLPKEVA